MGCSSFSQSHKAYDRGMGGGGGGGGGQVLCTECHISSSCYEYDYKLRMPGYTADCDA